MSFFRVDKLGIRFGGVVAVDNVSFEVKRGEVYTIIGPNGAGKTTIFNLIGLIYPATSGAIMVEARDLTGLPPHRVSERGLPRTCQNIARFQHATVCPTLRTHPPRPPHPTPLPYRPGRRAYPHNPLAGF